jgi:hypothetical protein
MTGPELRAARERLGVGRGELAARAGVAVCDLECWEESAAPPAVWPRLDRALWEFERTAVLAESDLTPCAWVAHFAAQADGPRKDPWTLERHIAQCPACQARGRYLEKRLRPRPPHPSWAWMPAWARAALVGAALALGATGAIIAVIILLVLAATSGDVSLLIVAVGVFVAFNLGGAAAGAVYHWTAPLRRGFFGRVLRWTLALEALLFLAAGVIAAATGVAFPKFGPEVWSIVANPLIWAALAAAGAVGGLAAACIPGDG